MNKPFLFEDERVTLTADRLQQHHVLCPLGAKDAYVAHVVKTLFARLPDSLVLVFVRSCRECHVLAVLLRGLGFEVSARVDRKAVGTPSCTRLLPPTTRFLQTAALHSQLSQQQRLGALGRFRAAQARVLVCTDVASRGLDIPRVDVVVNHNVPERPKTYVHRVGRSARAGRFGAAITFVTQYELDRLHALERHIRAPLPVLPVDATALARDAAAVFALRRESEIRVESRWRQASGRRRLHSLPSCRSTRRSAATSANASCSRASTATPPSACSSWTSVRRSRPAGSGRRSARKRRPPSDPAAARRYCCLLI